jgi:hypothetical protein
MIDLLLNKIKNSIFIYNGDNKIDNVKKYHRSIVATLYKDIDDMHKLQQQIVAHIEPFSILSKTLTNLNDKTIALNITLKYGKNKFMININSNIHRITITHI